MTLQTTIYSTLFFFSFFFTSMLAAQPTQPDPKNEEKIQALEVAFISRKLNLTTEEAQKFWPVYNEYKKDIKAVRDASGNKQQRDVVDMEQKIVDVRKKYKDRFSGVVGQPRMNQFFQAEHEFRGILLNRLNKNPAQRPMMKHRLKK